MHLHVIFHLCPLIFSTTPAYLFVSHVAILLTSRISSFYVAIVDGLISLFAVFPYNHELSRRTSLSSESLLCEREVTLYVYAYDFNAEDEC